jgi:hypothetical protein
MMESKFYQEYFTHEGTYTNYKEELITQFM